MKKMFLNLTMITFLTISQTACESEAISVENEITKEETAAKTGPWETVFVDNFNSNGNLNNWQKTNRNDYNSSRCFYSSSNPKIGSLDSKSCLQLSASKTGSNYTSGHVKSNLSFKPNNNQEYRVRASIKLIALSGSTYKGFGDTYGAWPAFWTVNETNWPTRGEIDIMEGYSFGNSTRFASNLFYGTSTGSNLLGNSAEKIYNNTEGWHTYQLSWKNVNGTVTVLVYLDGTNVATYTNSTNGNLKLQNFSDHNIIFNLNVGSDTGIFDNSRINLFSNTFMYVDWVQVDKRTL